VQNIGERGKFGRKRGNEAIYLDAMIGQA